MNKWKLHKIGEAIKFNPSENLRKGSKATGQPEILNAFTLYEMFENAGGDSAALAEVIAQVEGVE